MYAELDILGGGREGCQVVRLFVVGRERGAPSSFERRCCCSAAAPEEEEVLWKRRPAVLLAARRAAADRWKTGRAARNMVVVLDMVVTVGFEFGGYL